MRVLGETETLSSRVLIYYIFKLLISKININIMLILHSMGETPLFRRLRPMLLRRTSESKGTARAREEPVALVLNYR